MRVPRSVVLAAIASLPGCVLITGSTDGYHLVDAGIDGGACLSAADCVSDAGPQVCCVNITGTSVPAAACGPAPCSGSPVVQLCTTGTECGGTSCLAQNCAVGVAMFSIQACGAISSCTVAPDSGR
jgi:hypothetical protein